MKIIFGRKLCSACQDKKAEFDKAGVEYKYFDLDTIDGLAEAAYRGFSDQPLPIVLEE